MPTSPLQRFLFGQPKWTCPHCGSDIADRDVDLSKEIKRCRQCHKLSPCGPDEFARLCRKIENWQPEQKPVPAPTKPRTRIRTEGDTLRIKRKLGSDKFPVVTFSFLLAFTAQLVMMLMRESRDPSEMLIFFGILWFVLLCMLLYGLSAVKYLTVSPQGIISKTSVLGMSWTKTLPVSPRPTIRAQRTSGDGESPPRTLLELSSDGKTIQLGKGLNSSELLWIADSINRHIDEIVPPDSVSREAPLKSPQTTSWRDTGDADITLLHPHSSPAARPAQTRLQLDRQYNCTTVSRRDNWKWLVSALLACPLGIVISFVLFRMFASIGSPDLPLSFRLARLFALFFCVAMGLAWIFALLRAVFAPLIVHRWQFRQEMIVLQTQVVGVTFSRRRPIDQLHQIELRNERCSSDVHSASRRDQTEVNFFTLAFVDDNGDDITTISELRKEEALWIADELFKDFERWFIHVEGN